LLRLKHVVNSPAPSPGAGISPRIDASERFFAHFLSDFQYRCYYRPFPTRAAQKRLEQRGSHE